MKLTYTTNTEFWSLKNTLKNDGWNMASDAFWYQIFKKGELTLITERA